VALHGAALAANLHPAQCLAALKPLPAHAIPADAAFRQVDCPASGVGRAFAYDAVASVSRVSHAIAAGDIVARYPEFGARMVLPGDTLSLVVVSGSTRIERKVEALQAARPGERLFVRAADGDVLSVQYERAQP
jgi:hypothetical protein